MYHSTFYFVWNTKCRYYFFSGHLSQEGFLKFLLSEDNNIVPPDSLDLSHDMKQPLAHYFVNSSHNTYLQGKLQRSKKKKWILTIIPAIWVSVLPSVDRMLSSLRIHFDDVTYWKGRETGDVSWREQSSITATKIQDHNKMISTTADM